MSSLLKKLITALILTSFITIVLFSLASMTHGSDGRLAGDCPFSSPGASLCPQDMVALIIHHLSAYHAFLNVPIGSGLTTLIISLLLVIGVALVIFIHLPLLGPPSLILYSYPLVDSYNRKIVRWLSRLENSPSYP